MLAAIYPFLPFYPAVEVFSPHHLIPNLHIKITGNDRFMAVLHIILRHNTIILDTLLGKEIHCQDTVCLQDFPNLCEARPFQVFPINPLYNLCLFRLNNQPPFSILRVSKETVMVATTEALLSVNESPSEPE